jgi:succinate dehydrogenase/fumarate reductase iron-sulfur protein
MERHLYHYPPERRRSPYTQSFELEVDPDEYVLDGVERVWAFHDRSLVFRHACHHSTCGACGMRVNGVEKLTCITTIRSVTRNGGTLRVEPLRNFPVVSDLVVDMSIFYVRLDQARFPPGGPVDEANLGYEKDPPTAATTSAWWTASSAAAASAPARSR